MSEEQPAGDPIVGIDLGTTNSLVAVMRDGQPEVLADGQGEARVPSVVSIDEDGVLHVGAAALARALDHPEDTVWSIKRLMGRARADFSEEELARLPFRVVESERGLAQVQMRGAPYLPEEISARILAALKGRASAAMGEEVRRAVITVPAYFDDAQRQATRFAGQTAGLEVLRIVNEPTAAALAYGLDRSKSGRVVVYDLGGGTFDVSVLEIQEGLFRVRSTQGDTRLGGDDFDQVLAQPLVESLGEGEAPDPRLLQAVKRAAENAKIHLSDHDEVEYSVEDRRTGRALCAKATREQFEEAIEPLIERTLRCCRRALRDAELDRAEIGAVVLVGGSTRVPVVRRRVEEFFGRRPYVGLDPDRVVAIGAAVQADILDGRSRDLLLLDVIPLSLGIETFGGAVAKIVTRNSPIPLQAQDAFTTSVDDQTAIDVHVLQGERELVKDCRSLGRLRLSVPPLPAGTVRIDVQFLVDENGVLEVRATDRHTGRASAIEVVPSYGLTDEEIARVVTDSFEFAREDMLAHQRIDLINECRTMIRAVDKLLQEGGHGLSSEEALEVGRVRDEVEAGLDDEDVKALKARYDRFVQVTVPLAGNVMSEVALAAVKGRTIAEVLGEDEPAGEPVPAEEPERLEDAEAPEVSEDTEGSEETEEPSKDCGDLGDGFRASPGPREGEGR